jgi:murein DD-endopeptidase MepM/ murein hydrolase activator NlpD
MIFLSVNTLRSGKTSFSSIIVTKKGFLRFLFFLCFLSYYPSTCLGASEIELPGINNAIKTSMADSAICEQCSPVKGKVISPFGYRGSHKHTGADIKLQKGDTVRAALSGVVTKAAPYFGYGNLVILKHENNIETYYSHLSKCLVQEGDSVIAGAVVGLGGRTGRATTNHLHFEIRFSHVPQNPEKYFDFSSNTTKEPLLAGTSIVKRKEEPTPILMEESLQTETTVPDNIIVIQKGDTLYSLSKRYGTTVQQLQELNQLASTNLKIGLKLKIK